MILEQLIFGIGELLLGVPPFYFLLLFIVFVIAAVVVSSIFRFHLRKYAFKDYKTGMASLVYISGLGILAVIAMILLGIIFSQS